MNNYTMDELLSGYFGSRYVTADETVMPELSSKHKRKMKKAFRIFDKNTATKKDRTVKPLSFGKRLVFAAIIIVCLAFITGAVVMYFVPGFKGVVHPDNLHLFAVDTTSGEDEIKYVYDFPEAPEGFKLLEKQVYPFHTFIYYCETDFSEDDPAAHSKSIVITQDIKSDYDIHLDNERHKFVETTVNGHNALYMYGYYKSEISGEDMVSAILIWDNGDYIILISAHLSEEDEEYVFGLPDMLVTMPAEYTPPNNCD